MIVILCDDAQSCLEIRELKEFSELNHSRSTFYVLDTISRQVRERALSCTLPTSNPFATRSLTRITDVAAINLHKII